MISENNLGQDDVVEENGEISDDYRIDYLQQHIDQMELAVADGVELFSYCPWSATDLVSTHQGYKKRYGFIYINRDEIDLKDLRRMKKKSFFWYRDLIKQNNQ